MSEINTDDLVVKSNELIEGHYRLSAASQKIAAALISKVDPRGKGPLPEFQFSIPEYAKFFGLTESVAYRMINKTTLELKKITITLRKRNSMDFLHAGLFSYCHYSEKDRVVGFKFEPLMEAHIRDFAQNFTQYQVKQIRNIKSGHAIRLYELLRKSHPMSANNGQSFLTVDLDELKRILGIDPKHYSRFFDFKKTILIHSQDEMKEKTDLCFDFEAIRVGRKVGKIKFAIKHNRSFKGVVESHDVTPLELTLEDQLKAYFPNNILTLVQNEFDNDRIERNLKYVQEQQAMGSVEINHPGKYLLKAIKDDYAKPPESKSTIDRLLDTSWDIDGD